MAFIGQPDLKEEDANEDDADGMETKDDAEDDVGEPTLCCNSQSFQQFNYSQLFKDTLTL